MCKQKEIVQKRKMASSFLVLCYLRDPQALWVWFPRRISMAFFTQTQGLACCLSLKGTVTKSYLTCPLPFSLNLMQQALSPLLPTLTGHCSKGKLSIHKISIHNFNTIQHLGLVWDFYCLTE